MPERVRKVPRIVSTNVATHRFSVHSRSMLRRSWTITECRYAVAVSQGRNDAFSTGSQAQYPPHPSTSYDHHIPAMIAADRNPHDASIQRRERTAQSFAFASFEKIAPMANAKGTVMPTYPRYSSGGCTAIRMWFCSSVFGPGPSVGTGNT